MPVEFVPTVLQVRNEVGPCLLIGNGLYHYRLSYLLPQPPPQLVLRPAGEDHGVAGVGSHPAHQLVGQPVAVGGRYFVQAIDEEDAARLAHLQERSERARIIQSQVARRLQDGANPLFQRRARIVKKAHQHRHRWLRRVTQLPGQPLQRHRLARSGFAQQQQSMSRAEAFQ